MSGPPPADAWENANRDHLVAELNVLRLLLRPDTTDADRRRAEEALASARRLLPGESALDRVARGFGLSAFERSLLLLAAGPDLVATVGEELMAACGSARPSFGTALSVLPEAHWSALTPSAPLRRWNLVRLLDPSTPTFSPLAVDERVLHHLAGAGYLDPELAAVARPVPAPSYLPGSLRRAAGSVAESWAGLRTVHLYGPQAANLCAVAAAAAVRGNWTLLVAQVTDLPSEAGELCRTLESMKRETVLGGCAWAIDLEHADPVERGRVARPAEDLGAPLALLSGDQAPLGGQALTRVGIHRLELGERRELLRSALRRAGAPTAEADRAAGVFDLTVDAAEAAAQDAASGTPLWQACRERARPSVTGLAHVVRPRARWEDLVLPAGQRAQLRALVSSVRHRATVLGDWGFAGRPAQGLGRTALFAGPSGTGKTLAAEVLAADLGLDLVRVDLSQVVSKWVGETERHLREVFAAAEDSAAVLLFDEADALFGRRTEVRDSHDRYANLQTGYLLQRLESFRGLAILTTNARSALDPAFTRRLHTVVVFPYPDVAAREALWRGAFPARTPVDGVDAAALAAEDLAGGGIAAVALSAAYLAAAERTPVTGEHVRTALRWELAKSGRSSLAR
ncbi:ATP-binding protein [Streptomyces sp. JHA26]|uniref:ATP-binding protein n=1 Tax=Streptomyces sp. JHA26 TaxID=1917143 RepID=UPI00098AC766|nr:ATP-binding protein [Streptomyces sp. JHA26]